MLIYEIIPCLNILISFYQNFWEDLVIMNFLLSAYFGLKSILLTIVEIQHLILFVSRSSIPHRFARYLISTCTEKSQKIANTYITPYTLVTTTQIFQPNRLGNSLILFENNNKEQINPNLMKNNRYKPINPYLTNTQKIFLQQNRIL